MSVKNIVKVMNFHALLRVDEARRKVKEANNYETELKSVISSILNNRIISLEKLSLKLPTDAKELNVYIGSDLGFCAGFNSDVISFIKNDDEENDKIIVGKRVNIKPSNTILYMDKDDFPKDYNKIFDLILNGVMNKLYSKINVIYIHYYNINKQEVLKRTILPFDFNSDLNDSQKQYLKNDDFVVEGDLMYILWSLISIYVSTEIKIAEAWSWASENVKRQEFTNESIKKLDDMEQIKKRQELKEKNAKSFSVIIENNNRKVIDKAKEA